MEAVGAHVDLGITVASRQSVQRVLKGVHVTVPNHLWTHSILVGFVVFEEETPPVRTDSLQLVHDPWSVLENVLVEAGMSLFVNSA